MMKSCPICGKYFVVHWPEWWTYRRREHYLCSENCLIVFDTKEYRERVGWIEGRKRQKGKNAMKKLTLQQKKKAAQIAISGGNPLDYLRELGIKNPANAWMNIKEYMEKNDPENYAKIPKRIKAQPQQLTAKVTGPVVVDGPAEIPEVVPAEVETPEQFQHHPSEIIRAIEEKEGKPIDQILEEKRKTMYQGHDVMGYKVTSIRHPILGEFYHDWKYNTIDWRAPDGAEVSLSPSNWWDLAECIPEIMAIIGGDPHEKSDP